MVSKQRLVETFIDLVEIDSESGDEAEIREVLKAKLIALGYAGFVYDVSQSASYKKYAGQCLKNMTIDVIGLPVIGQLL